MEYAGNPWNRKPTERQPLLSPHATAQLLNGPYGLVRFYSASPLYLALGLTFPRIHQGGYQGGYLAVRERAWQGARLDYLRRQRRKRSPKRRR